MEGSALPSSARSAASLAPSSASNSAPSPTSAHCERLLFAVDALWSSFIVFPLIVVYWSGTWYLLDLYLLPAQPLYSALACLGTGTFILVLAFHAMPRLQPFLQPRPQPDELQPLRRPSDPTPGLALPCSLSHLVVSRVAIYLCALGVLAYFRGVWNLIDLGLSEVRGAGDRLWVSAVMAGGAQVALWVLRAGGNAPGSPLVLQVDCVDDFYSALPRCRTPVASLCRYTLDVVLTVLLILSLVVMLWASLWQLGDACILPHSPILHSLLLSLAAGYVCTALLFTAQRPLERLLHYLVTTSSQGGQGGLWLSHGGRRMAALVVEGLYGAVSTVVVLLLWRGLWGFVKTFVLTEAWGPRLGWAFHLGGFTLMVALQVGRTLGSVGCAVDGESFCVEGSRGGLNDLEGAPGEVDPGAQGMAHRVEYFALLHRRWVHRHQSEDTFMSDEDGLLINDRRPLLLNVQSASAVNV